MVLAEHSDSYLRSERSIVSLRFGQGKTHAFLKLFLGSLSDVGSFQPPKSIKPAPTGQYAHQTIRRKGENSPVVR